MKQKKEKYIFLGKRGEKKEKVSSEARVGWWGGGREGNRARRKLVERERTVKKKLKIYNHGLFLRILVILFDLLTFGEICTFKKFPLAVKKADTYLFSHDSWALSLPTKTGPRMGPARLMKQCFPASPPLLPRSVAAAVMCFSSPRRR